MKNHHRFYRYLLILCLLEMAALTLPFPHRRIYTFIGLIALGLLTVYLGRPIHFRQRRFHGFDRLYQLLGVVAVISQSFWLLSPSSLHALTGIPVLILLGSFLFWSLKRLVACLALETLINADVLAGAVAGYLLLGTCGGLFFSVLETIAPGSFVYVEAGHRDLILGGWSGSNAQLAAWSYDLSRIYYFAFVSLTTVGYGDIVPVSTAAQMSSVVLSISGPLYLAVVMGILISRFTVQSEKAAPKTRKLKMRKPDDS